MEEELPVKVITPRPKRRLRNLSIRKASSPCARPEGSEECHEACTKCTRATVPQELVEAACGHSLCKNCVAAHVERAVEQLRCTGICCPCEGCGAALDASFVQNSTPEELNQQFLDACFSEFMALEARADDIHLVTCPRQDPPCGCPMEWLQPSEEEVKKYGEDKITRKAEDGTPLSRAAWVHFNINRIRCPQCSADFCASCMVQPYHLGATCEQLKEYAASKQCRFCGCRVTLGVNLAPLCAHETLMSCCDDEECLEKRDTACHQVHACGHACGGVRDEERCLPCLQPDCLEGAKDGHADIHDFCSICWISDLGSEPCIQLTCQHFVHARCATRVLESKWNTSYINFEFWNCPTCKAPLDHPYLNQTLAPLKALRQRVVEIGKKVVDDEAVTEDLRSLNDKASKYYGKVDNLVLDKLTFFQCDRCGEPFYGGRMDCIERNALETHDDGSERLCHTCEAKSVLVCSTPSHQAFWVYKCRYCCSRAKFFCFGDSHFCEPCHGNVGALRQMEAHPQCSGPKECPLAMEHAPNGEEYVIGCELCLEEFERSPEETRRLREHDALQERRRAIRKRAVTVMSRASLALFSILALVQASDWEVLAWTAWTVFHVLKFSPAAVAVVATIMMFLPRRTFSRRTLLAAVVGPMVALLVAMDVAFAFPLFSGFEIVSFFKFQDVLFRIASYIARIGILILPGCFSLLYLLEQPSRAMKIAACGVILNALSFVFGFVSGHSSLGDIVDASVAVVRVAYVCFILLGYVSYSMFKCNLGFQHNRWRMLELLASFAVCWAMIMELVIYNVGHVDHVFALQYYDILLRLVLLARFAPWVMFAGLLVWPPSSVFTQFRLYVLLLSSFVAIEASCWYFQLTWCALFWNCLTIFRCAVYKC